MRVHVCHPLREMLEVEEVWNMVLWYLHLRFEHIFLHDKRAHRRTSSSLFLFLSLCYQTHQTWTLFLHSTANLALCSQFLCADRTERRHDIPRSEKTASRKQIIHQTRIKTASSSSAESRCLCSAIALRWPSQCRVVVCVLRCVSKYNLRFFSDSFLSLLLFLHIYFHLWHSPICCDHEQQCQIESSRCCITTQSSN